MRLPARPRVYFRMFRASFFFEPRITRMTQMFNRYEDLSSQLSTLNYQLVLPSGDCAHHEKRFVAFNYRIGQGSFRWVVGNIFTAHEKAD